MTIMGTVRLAAIVYTAGFGIDDFLTRVADQLRADRINMAGVLQENARDDAGVCSAMTLVDLTSRGRYRISQDLGSQAEGCRLDAHGLAEIGVLLDRPLGHYVELLILNRFGKAEAEGSGLRSAFVRAMEAGIPLLTVVRSPNTEAWSEFHGGLAIDLIPDLDPVIAWCRDAVREVRELRAARRTELSPSVHP
jgi:nucleoside-triphosphatase THEP1